MTHDERVEWADDHGYTSGRCPRCHRQVWSDTSVFECSCGWSSEPEEEEEMDGEWEPGKTYRLRGGGKARIYATDGGGEYPIHGAVWDQDSGFWELENWRANGRYLNAESNGMNLTGREV